MSTGGADEVYRIAFQEAGTGALDDAQKAVERLRSGLQTLGQQYGSGVISSDDYYNKTARIAGELDKAQKRVDALGSAVKGAGVHMQSGSRLLLDFGRAAQDLTQGGIGGVINNVEGLSSNFARFVGISASTAAGIAGVGTAVATLGFIVYNNYGRIKTFFGMDEIKQFTSNLEGMKARIKELNDTPIKLAVDTHELNALEARVKQIETATARVNALAQKPTEAESERGHMVEQAIVQFPGGAEGVRAKLRPGARAANLQQGELDAMEKQVASLDAEIAAETAKGTVTGQERANRAKKKRDELAEKALTLRQKIENDINSAVDKVISDALSGKEDAVKALLGNRAFANAAPENVRLMTDAMKKTPMQEKQEAQFQQLMAPIFGRLQAIVQEGRAGVRKPQEIEAAVNRAVFNQLRGKVEGPRMLEIARLANLRLGTAGPAGRPPDRQQRRRRERRKPPIQIRAAPGAPRGKAAQPAPRPRLAPIQLPKPKRVAPVVLPAPKRAPMPIVPERGNAYLPGPGEAAGAGERQLRPMDVNARRRPAANPAAGAVDKGPGAVKLLNQQVKLQATTNQALAAVDAKLDAVSQALLLQQANTQQLADKLKQTRPSGPNRGGW